MQLFAGHHTKFVSTHPIKDTGEPTILGAFQDCLQWHDAPEELAADNDTVYNGFLYTKYVVIFGFIFGYWIEVISSFVIFSCYAYGFYHTVEKHEEHIINWKSMDLYFKKPRDHVI